MSLSVYYDRYECTEKPNSGAQEMVLLHGWGLHSGVWDSVMENLLTQFNITIIDLPGMGRSPVANAEYDMDYLVQQIMPVVPDRAIWLGWSLGAMVATQVAAEFPERVSALICVASNPRFTQADDWPNAMPQKIMQGFRDYFAEDWEGTLIRFLSLQCKDSHSVKADTRALREMLMFHGLPAVKALREGLGILANTDQREIIAKLNIPILFLFGDKDNLVPINVSNDVAKLNNRITVATIEGSSHVPFLSDADLFLQALTDFLSEQADD